MKAGQENIAHGEKVRSAILNYVKSYFAKHGYAPSFREIGNGVGLSSASSVHAHICRMLSDGSLETDAPEGTPRALRVPGSRFVLGRGPDDSSRGR